MEKDRKPKSDNCKCGCHNVYNFWRTCCSRADAKLTEAKARSTVEAGVSDANGDKFITEARISNNCIAIHGEEKAFDIAMTHIKNNYKMFLNTKKVIVIKMELR